MSNALSRFLYRSYPALLLCVTVLVWASTNQAEVATLNLPPLGGENLYSNPSPQTERSCEQSKKTTFGFRVACGDDGTTSLSRHYSKILQLNPIKQTN